MDWARFNFVQTYDIAMVLRAIPNGIRPLVRRINTVRNEFAHKIGLDLDLSTALSVYNEMPEEFRHRFDGTPATPKQIVNYVFSSILWLIDLNIARVGAERERIRQKTTRGGDA